MNTSHPVHAGDNDGLLHGLGHTVDGHLQGTQRYTHTLAAQEGPMHIYANRQTVIQQRRMADLLDHAPLWHITRK